MANIRPIGNGGLQIGASAEPASDGSDPKSEPRPVDPLPPALPPAPAPMPQIPYSMTQPPQVLVPQFKTWLEAKPWIVPAGGSLIALLVGLSIGVAIGRRRRPTV